MIKYKYIVEEVLPDHLETTLKKLGTEGYRLFNITALNKVSGINLDRSPRIQTTWQLIFEKPQNTE